MKGSLLNVSVLMGEKPGAYLILTEDVVHLTVSATRVNASVPSRTDNAQSSRILPVWCRGYLDFFNLKNKCFMKEERLCVGITREPFIQMCANISKGNLNYYVTD